MNVSLGGTDGSPSYVHRLIQTRNDGKLVELPSLSSLITSPTSSRPLTLARLTQPPSLSAASTRPAEPERAHSSSSSSALPHRDEQPSSPDAGPSLKDMDKMSTIEDITLEYSYLLSSQLETMREHYESLAHSQSLRLATLEHQSSEVEQAIKARERAERQAEKASEAARVLQVDLEAEKAMTKGLSERIRKVESELQGAEREKRERAREVSELEETVGDLMFSLEAGRKIQEAGGADAGQGGDLVVVQGKANDKAKGKKKKK
jgi:BRCA1-associated protein